MAWRPAGPGWDWEGGSSWLGLLEQTPGAGSCSGMQVLEARVLEQGAPDPGGSVCLPPGSWTGGLSLCLHLERGREEASLSSQGTNPVGRGSP